MPHVLRSPTSPAPDPSAPPALSDLSFSLSALSADPRPTITTALQAPVERTRPAQTKEL